MATVDVKKWWVWGYWSSPLTYTMNALAINEFRGKSWDHVRFLSMKLEAKNYVVQEPNSIPCAARTPRQWCGLYEHILEAL